jgi:hypothetical protein
MSAKGKKLPVSVSIKHLFKIYRFWLDIAQNAAENAGIRPIGYGGDDITEKRLNVAVYPNAFVFENRRL